MANDKYSVGVYDCAGEYKTVACDDFANLLIMVRHCRAMYPDKVVEAFNLDRCDHDTNGLTEDERDALDEVV